VFGYATTSAGFLDRTQAQFNTEQKDGAWWDQDGLMVEQFGLFDNLMVEAALMDTGGLIREDADRWRDLTLFERCVTVAARALT
jgi:nucleoside 2-deoxyribosyltransferase